MPSVVPEGAARYSKARFNVSCGTLVVPVKGDGAVIEIRIPKEVNTYEAKFIGPFTMRQSICLLITLPVCVLLYNFLRPYAPVDVVGVVCIFPASLAYLFGWFKPYGMKFEKFLQSVFITVFLAPSKRKYRTVNFYETLADEIRKEEAAQAEADAKNKKVNKKKYKRSKEAIQ